MSRFGDEEYENNFNNQGDFWRNSLNRALRGKRGRQALRDLREALEALPEAKLIEGAMCTVNAGKRTEAIPVASRWDQWRREEMADKVAADGEGVCAVGAYAWYQRVKAGADPAEAFDSLPTLLDSDGDGSYDTFLVGHGAGLVQTIAWHLAWMNDERFGGMTPPQRHTAFLTWIDEQLALPPLGGAS